MINFHSVRRPTFHFSRMEFSFTKFPEKIGSIKLSKLFLVGGGGGSWRSVLFHIIWCIMYEFWSKFEPYNMLYLFYSGLLRVLMSIFDTFI